MLWIFELNPKQYTFKSKKPPPITIRLKGVGQGKSFDGAQMLEMLVKGIKRKRMMIRMDLIGL